MEANLVLKWLTESNLKAYIVEHPVEPSIKRYFGNYVHVSHTYYCGYIVIPEKYVNILNKKFTAFESPFRVHGGITFKDYTEEYRKFKEWFGDCFIIGFDTCHLGDEERGWNIASVKEECENLSWQIGMFIDLEKNNDLSKN